MDFFGIFCSIFGVMSLISSMFEVELSIRCNNLIVDFSLPLPFTDFPFSYRSLDIEFITKFSLLTLIIKCIII